MEFSRLRELGPRFARLLHRHIVTSPHACCFVAHDGDTVLGYCSAALDTDRFTRAFKLRYGWMAALLLLPAALRSRGRATIRRALTYDTREHFGAHQKVSTLTFAVRKDRRAHGVGKALFQAAMDEFARHGIDEFTFHTVADPSQPASPFYRGLGCEYQGTEPFYDDTVASVFRWRRSDADEARGE